MSKPKLIAEISANHCGNFYIAKKLIKCARDNGADYVKLQTYTADSMTIKSNKKDFQINAPTRALVANQRKLFGMGANQSTIKASL